MSEDSLREIRTMIIAALPFPPLPVLVARLEQGDGRLHERGETTVHTLIARCLDECARRRDPAGDRERRMRQCRAFQRLVHAIGTDGFNAGAKLQTEMQLLLALSKILDNTTAPTVAPGDLQKFQSLVARALRHSHAATVNLDAAWSIAASWIRICTIPTDMDTLSVAVITASASVHMYASTMWSDFEKAVLSILTNADTRWVAIAANVLCDTLTSCFQHVWCAKPEWSQLREFNRVADHYAHILKAYVLFNNFFFGVVAYIFLVCFNHVCVYM